MNSSRTKIKTSIWTTKTRIIRIWNIIGEALLVVFQFPTCDVVPFITCPFQMHHGKRVSCCFPMFFPAFILLREQRLRDSRINSIFWDCKLSTIFPRYVWHFDKIAIYRLLSRWISDVSIFKLIFVENENTEAPIYYLPAWGAGDLKSSCERLKFDSEMRLNWGVIWQNVVHQ